MKIRYQNTRDDILAFRRHHREHTPDMRKGMRILLAVPAALCVALGVLAAVEWQNLAYVAGGAVLGLVWVGALWWLIRRSFRASDRRLMSKGLNHDGPRWHEMELADGALVERTDNNSHSSSL